ncbi:SDR family NAD(P)-dependent oxidoreductase [Geodermatophilus sabuli]|uniref:2-hydroxycyclohexane-1-carbonyl-CoA dehydrogenase n=1 Tax=Geodermatophilus sabuli TaxID=1564158 RepID=A0A285E682_9ACTN|nr:SDR family NAD(P)-dependent oxidoreductase [Geodermatophilus sabuli]MBB3082511.1 2-hydroxycyclohexanecarboxyl-CoA dehydrogenase [Geodermatophilus sabuli]SNX94619.1 2-hydroxycyclohexane-1-carbonyl-CoA dehydrogenase [Geodermatophilus sabuli]
MQLSLEGRVALVTGSGQGIGAAIAAQLAHAGAHVAVCDLQPDRADGVARDLSAQGLRARAFTCDVTSPEAVASLTRTVTAAVGPIDIVVNNVGWAGDDPFVSLSDEQIRRLVDVNLMSTMFVCRDVGATMIERRAGRIINIASDAGRVGSGGQAVYAATKGAVIALTKSLAREWAKHGVTANCVSPGITDTPLWGETSERIKSLLLAAVPLKRVGQPADIAYAVTFLASEEASYITGQVLSVSGGLSMVD